MIPNSSGSTLNLLLSRTIRELFSRSLVEKSPFHRFDSESGTKVCYGEASVSQSELSIESRQVENTATASSVPTSVFPFGRVYLTLLPDLPVGTRLHVCCSLKLDIPKTVGVCEPIRL